METSDDPITIALVAGTAISATAQIQQGRAAKSAAKAEGRAATEAASAAALAAEEQGSFQEKIASRNAEQAIREAEGKRLAASEAAIQRERQGKELKGRIVAAQAKSGTAVGRGSNLATLVQAAQDTEADRLTILREGAIAGASDRFKAGTITAQGRAANLRGKASGRASRARGLSISKAAKTRGNAAKRFSVLSAVGTGVSGGANAALTQKRIDGDI